MQPQCSHCLSYGANCTYAAPSRKYKSKKRQPTSEAQPESGDTQARLHHLESLLEQVSKRLEASEKRNVTHPSASPLEISLHTPIYGSLEHGNSQEPPPVPSTLPPLRQVLPIVYTFLQKFNAVLPLFEPQSLLQLVRSFYQAGPNMHRDPVAWAAINVVLAIAYSQNLVKNTNNSIRRCVDYFNRAQQALSAK